MVLPEIPLKFLIKDNLTLSAGMRLTKTLLNAKWKEINNINETTIPSLMDTYKS